MTVVRLETGAPPGEPNEVVVAVAEALLADARAGLVSAIGVGAVRSDGQVITMVAGDGETSHTTSLLCAATNVLNRRVIDCLYSEDEDE